MNLSCLVSILRPAAPVCLLAVSSLFVSGCFGVGKKGEAGLVVSSVDPAVVANAGRVDMTVAEPEADYSAGGIEEFVEDTIEPYLDGNDEVRAMAEKLTGRTEITPVAEDLEEYKIKKGDSLTSISREFGTSIDALKRANGMSDDTLVAGKTIRLPGAVGASDEVTAERSAEKESSEVVATVPTKVETTLKEEPAEELPETLPSGVVPPAPPRRPVLSAPDEPEPVKKEGADTTTTIGDDGFLRFDDE